MTIKLTERDKKLLILMAVVLLVAGIGGLVILPLLDKNAEVRAELEQEKIKQAENRIKVEGLVAMEQARDSMRVSVADYSGNYLKIIGSKEIDRMLTETATSAGLMVNRLIIDMPGEGEITTLMDYGMALNAVAEEELIRSFGGFYTASVSLTMSGRRQVLQSVMDTLMHREPAMRVTSFRWETSRYAEQALSLVLDIYMMADMDAYVNDNVQVVIPEEDGEAKSSEEVADDVIKDFE